jgi:di/tricarboxylate transporter
MVTVDIAIVFILIFVAMVLFSMDSVRYDLVAMILMSALMLTGLLNVKEGLSGFSNQATITIAAMFGLSSGIRNTGALRLISRRLDGIGRLSLPNAALIVMAVIAVISAFINNTAFRELNLA